MTKGKNKRRGICYLCGKEGIVTDDHVPPQCLAPQADNSIFYKLPAHERCNNALSVHESRCQVPEKLNIKVRVNKGQLADHDLWHSDQATVDLTLRVAGLD